jgi:ABC-type molybdate transport system ATPase subunit
LARIPCNICTGILTDARRGDQWSERAASPAVAGEFKFATAITRRSADSLDLKVGDTVTAIIKSTEILIGKI